jgi:hypothetical protein
VLRESKDLVKNYVHWRGERSDRKGNIKTGHGFKTCLSKAKDAKGIACDCGWGDLCYDGFSQRLVFGESPDRCVVSLAWIAHLTYWKSLMD